MLEIEKLRGISIIAVVIIHALAPYYAILEVNLTILSLMYVDVLIHFAVPCFLMISGIVLAKYINFNWITFYNKRFRTLFVSYLIASLWYFVYWYLRTGYNPPIGDLIQSIPGANAAYHLWYFAPLVQLYLVYPILNLLFCLVKDTKWKYGVLILMFGIQWYSVSVQFICQGANYIFYFALGIYLARYKGLTKIYKLSPKIIAGLSTLSLFLCGFKVYRWAIENNGMSLAYNNPIGIWFLEFVMIIATILVLMNLLEKIRGKWLIELGKYSYGIYLYHVTFVFLFVDIAEQLHFSSSTYVYYIVGSLWSLYTSYILVKLMSRVEALKPLIGMS